MYRSLFPLVLLAAACGSTTAPPPAPTPRAATAVAPAPPPPPAPPKKPEDYTVVDVAVNSPDHKTLVTAVQAAGLVNALNSPGGIYTVFAPTDAAFAKLPAGTVDELLKPEKQSDLKKILQHHAAVPIVPLDGIKDGQTLTMADGTDVTFHVNGKEVMVGDAHILGTANAVNGVVYVIDAVLLPPS